MDKMDAITSYTQKLLDGYETKTNAGDSDQTVESNMRSTVAI